MMSSMTEAMFSRRLEGAVAPRPYIFLGIALQVS